MNTYVTVQMSSEGALASEVTEIFVDLGFNATLGNHDFVYKWKEKFVTPEKVIAFVDKVQKRLKGTGVMLHFATIR
jgi:hypothetical protein